MICCIGKNNIFFSKTRRISRTEPELIDFVSFKMSKIARGIDLDGNFRTSLFHMLTTEAQSYKDNRISDGCVGYICMKEWLIVHNCPQAQ